MFWPRVFPQSAAQVAALIINHQLVRLRKRNAGVADQERIAATADVPGASAIDRGNQGRATRTKGRQARPQHK